MKAIIKLGLENMSVSLSGTYVVKPADVLSPVLFNFALEYVTG
jgi:hypothetical protein